MNLAEIAEAVIPVIGANNASPGGVLKKEELAELAAIQPGEQTPDDPSKDLDKQAGKIYFPVIADQLVQERARKTTIETRALTLTTLSGTFVALFAAMVELTELSLPGIAVACVGIAFLLFFVAGLAGIWANFRLYDGPGSYVELRQQDMEVWASKENWTSPDRVNASHVVALAQLRVLQQARVLNTYKRATVARGFGYLVSGAIFVAIAAFTLILWGAPASTPSPEPITVILVTPTP